MTPLLLLDPLAEGPARRALAHNGLASHAQEWRREWQRAQACAWLHATPVPLQGETPPIPLRESLAGEAPATAIDPGAQVDAIRVVHNVAPLASGCGATSGISAYSMALPVHGARIAPDAVTGEGAPAPILVSGRQEGPRQQPVPTEAMRVAPPLRTPVPDKDAVRVHVEHADDGLHVWIGADGEGAAMPARAAAIVAELRRFEQGPAAPLASIVFNGRTLHASGARAASPGETSK